MRFRLLSLILATGTLFSAYACGDDATIANPSGDGGFFSNPDASAAGNGGTANQTDGSVPPGGGGNSGNPDAATIDDAGLDAGDSSIGVGEGGLGGDGYGIVYSAESAIGIDGRPECSATFDSDGNLIGYEASAMEMLSIGDATLQSAGNNGVLAWGTWVGGPTTGVFYANATGEFTFGSNDDGFHFAVGKTATTLPTGVVTYELVGASEPTSNTGTMPGTIDSATVVIDYDSGPDSAFGVAHPVAVEIVLTTEDGTITYETMGGIGDLSNTEGATYDMSFHANTAIGNLRGVILEDGDALAVALVLNQGSGVDGGPAPRVRGALALQRQ
jgi:hypothetical protein